MQNPGNIDAASHGETLPPIGNHFGPLGRPRYRVLESSRIAEVENRRSGSLRALKGKRASPEARFVSGSHWHRRPARPLEIIRLGGPVGASPISSRSSPLRQRSSRSLPGALVTKKTWHHSPSRRSSGISPPAPSSGSRCNRSPRYTLQ